MSAINTPKALIAPTGAEAVYAKQHQQLSLEDAAKRVQERAKERAKATNKLKRKAITTGALSRVPVLFNYASGATSWISIPKDNAKKFGIVDAPDSSLAANGRGITKTKTKEIKISYGFKIVKRKKAAGRGVTSRGGNALDTQVRAWISVSVPSDATFLDVIAFAKALPKPPGMLRYGRQDFIINYKRAIGGAGAAR